MPLDSSATSSQTYDSPSHASFNYDLAGNTPSSGGSLLSYQRCQHTRYTQSPGMSPASPSISYNLQQSVSIGGEQSYDHVTSDVVNSEELGYDEDDNVFATTTPPIDITNRNTRVNGDIEEDLFMGQRNSTVTMRRVRHNVDIVSEPIDLGL